MTSIISTRKEVASVLYFICFDFLICQVDFEVNYMLHVILDAVFKQEKIINKNLIKYD